ncbi:MAG: rhodanese-like domain-containing protein [Bacteroidota bacterium]|jgi:rhodanese-related sulfurtransferase
MLVKFVTENIFLIAIAFVSGAMLVWPLVRRGAGGPSVNTLEATMLMNKKDSLVLDVREPGEFAEGHIINARNIPLDQLETRLKEIERYKDRPVIVACAVGNRSGGAAGLLRKNGFTNVVNLSGGIAAWRQAGLPTEK